MLVRSINFDYLTQGWILLGTGYNCCQELHLWVMGGFGTNGHLHPWHDENKCTMLHMYQMVSLNWVQLLCQLATMSLVQYFTWKMTHASSFWLVHTGLKVFIFSQLLIILHCLPKITKQHSSVFEMCTDNNEWPLLSWWVQVATDANIHNS